MKLCKKHQLFLDDKVTYEEQVDILSEYNEKLDVASYQDKIEYRKNNCQVCYFGAMGKNILEKMIKNMNEVRLVML